MDHAPDPQLQQSLARASAIGAATHAFSEATIDYERLLGVVARELAELLKNTCTVQLVTEDGAGLEPVAVHATDPDVVVRVRALLAAAPIRIADHALYRAVLESGSSMLVPRIDPAAHRRAASAPHAGISESLGMHSGLIVAMRVHGRSIGTLSLGRYEPELPAFDEADRELAETIAVHAALAISNARLLREATREIADRKRAETELRRTQEHLRQAQKMEAIGRLAGGVAHDFNNLLSVILAYADLVRSEMSAEDPLRGDVEEIWTAGQRAADLTRQLLAFSRQQLLEPRVFDLAASIAAVQRMLRTLVGEDVALHLEVAHPLWTVNADPGQMEQVLMNLVVNARDAMPEGGKVTIEAANVELDEEYARARPEVTPGPHVMLSVTDTGVGMDKETQARIFEPFFTTKAVGKGTGLGLATVFGIVKQSGGSIFVYSEPGHGTSFRVYLPRATEPAAVTEPARPPLAPHGVETILVVEDETQVRAALRTILTRAGYTVLEASDGDDALRLFAERGDAVDLVVTDVVMPAMSGRDLVERMRAARASLRVLFMSGYTGDAVMRHGVLEPGVSFLQKPLTPSAVLAKVREVLDAAG